MPECGRLGKQGLNISAVGVRSGLCAWHQQKSCVETQEIVLQQKAINPVSRSSFVVHLILAGGQMIENCREAVCVWKRCVCVFYVFYLKTCVCVCCYCMAVMEGSRLI